MKAKYESCGKRIQAGDHIKWTKGQPARHLTCPDVSGGSADHGKIREQMQRACGSQIQVGEQIARLKDSQPCTSPASRLWIA